MSPIEIRGGSGFGILYVLRKYDSLRHLDQAWELAASEEENSRPCVGEGKNISCCLAAAYCEVELFRVPVCRCSFRDSYLHCGGCFVSVVIDRCECGCVHACCCVDVIRHEAMDIGRTVAERPVFVFY